MGAHAGRPPGPPKTKRGWTVVFTGARLEEVREVWIGPRRLRGPGTVEASVTVGGDKRVSIRDVDARFEIDGRLPSGAAALDYYLRNAPWVTFSGGEARLSARLEVEGGRLLSTSRRAAAPARAR